MKTRMGNVMLGAVMTLVVLGTSALRAAPEDPVFFADANLKQAVKDALGITTDPTQAQMATLTQLHAGGRGITDLTGIEYAVNLTFLQLRVNQITDVSPLSGLTNLTDLVLPFNQISDLSPLVGLANLRQLRLHSNQISNLSPLSGLVNLTELRLSTNQISDVSPLSGLTSLTSLTLGSNQISDISPLSGLVNLTDLTLELNQISNLGPLSGLTYLAEIWLGSNQITDISPLSGLTKLTILRLQSNQISNVSALSGLTNLTDLRLVNNQINDISPLSGMTSLTILRLQINQISDISPLTAMMDLDQLWLTSNPLNWYSYCEWIPMIQTNNPGIDLSVDPNPYNCLVPPAETPAGSLVSVTLEDSSNPGTSPVSLTFEEIAESGGTSLVTSDLGPTPPGGFQLGNPATYYEITTTASYSGLIEVCISYSGVSYTGPPEGLRLWHYDDGSWVDCTTLVDTENQLVCGLVTSLSAFAIVEDIEPPAFESITATPNVLWPPDHKLAAITVNYVVRDNLEPGPEVILSRITMNEGDETNTYDPTFDNTVGDGHTTDDIQVDEAGVVYLRAERSGAGTGRLYTLTYKAIDLGGNVTTATVTVAVPHEAP